MSTNIYGPLRTIASSELCEFVQSGVCTKVPKLVQKKSKKLFECHVEQEGESLDVTEIREWGLSKEGVGANLRRK